MSQVALSLGLTHVQLIGLAIALVGVILLILNGFSKKDDGNFNIELFGQKVSGPKSSLVLLCGVFIMLLPSAAPKLIEKANEVMPPSKETPSKSAGQADKPTVETSSSDAHSPGESHDANASSNLAPQQARAENQAHADAGRVAPAGRNEEASASSQSTTSSAVSPPKILGWAFFGTYRDGDWKSKYFDGGTGRDGAPRRNDTVTAVMNVTIRLGPAQQDGFRWENQPKTGLIEAGDALVVGSVVQVAPGYYWMEISQ